MAARAPSRDGHISRREPWPLRPGEVEIVAMRRRHLRSVLRIESLVYPRPWSLGLFVSELTLRTSRCYCVAMVGHEVVGYAGLMLCEEDAHVTTVAVAPAWQRHKLGTRLLLHLVGQSRQRGARHLTLEVRVGNRGAQALYHRFGFVPAGIRKNYYSETNEDALVMWASDIDDPRYTLRLDQLEAGLADRGDRPEAPGP